jgi:hypothetical protein
MKDKKKMTRVWLAGFLVLVLLAGVLISCGTNPTSTTPTTTPPTTQPTTTPTISPSAKPSTEVTGAGAGKYAKYVTPMPIEPGPIHGPWIDLQGENYENVNFRFIYRFITKPVYMVPFSHSHEFVEFMMFFGSDPKDISDFPAEIEFSLGAGADQEKFVITSPTVVFIPKGLMHCPLNFKRVDQTITMVIVALTPRYDVPHEGH